MAIDNRTIEEHIARLKENMDFDGANELRKMQDDIYHQYMKEMRNNMMYDSQQNPMWGTVTGVSNLGLTAAQIQRQRRRPEFDVLYDPMAQPIGPEWRGAAIRHVKVSNSSAQSDSMCIEFMAGNGMCEAHVYVHWKTSSADLRAKAQFYVELLNQWRVGEVTVSIDI